VVILEESMAMIEETTASDAAHERDWDTKTPDTEQMYANILPEHCLLLGLFFAREAESCDESLESRTEDAVVVCPPAPKDTLEAVRPPRD